MQGQASAFVFTGIYSLQQEGAFSVLQLLGRRLASPPGLCQPYPVTLHGSEASLSLVFI